MKKREKKSLEKFKILSFVTTIKHPNNIYGGFLTVSMSGGCTSQTEIK